MKDKYYIEITFTYSNYRWVIDFTSDKKILTKTDLEEVKEHIESSKEERIGGNLMIVNMITVLNK